MLFYIACRPLKSVYESGNIRRADIPPDHASAIDQEIRKYSTVIVGVIGDLIGVAFNLAPLEFVQIKSLRLLKLIVFRHDTVKFCRKLDLYLFGSTAVAFPSELREKAYSVLIGFNLVILQTPVCCCDCFGREH